MAQNKGPEKNQAFEPETADTTIRQYIESQDPAQDRTQEYIEEEFDEAQHVSKHEPGEDLRRQRKQE